MNYSKITSFESGDLFQFNCKSARCIHMSTHTHTYIYTHTHTHCVAFVFDSGLQWQFYACKYAYKWTTHMHWCNWYSQRTVRISANCRHLSQRQGEIHWSEKGRIYQTHGAYRHNKMATTTNMSLGKPFKPFKNQTAGMGDRFFIFRMIRECEKPVLPIRYPQFLQDMGGIPSGHD